MLRPIIFLHRWLGIIVGLLMTIWCLSGFVMMHVDYPRLTPGEQLQGLAPLQLPAAATGKGIGLPSGTALTAARVEMLAGRPVLRIGPQAGPEPVIAQMRATPGTFDLVSDRPVDGIDQADVASVARTFGERKGVGDVRAILYPAIAPRPTMMRRSSALSPARPRTAPGQQERTVPQANRKSAAEKLAALSM